METSGGKPRASRLNPTPQLEAEHLLRVLTANLAFDADPERKHRAADAVRRWRARTPGESTESALILLRAAAADYGHSPTRRGGPDPTAGPAHRSPN